MKICIISPIDYLEKLSARSTSQMALTHLVLKSEKYRLFYKSMSERGDFIILDNSFHELRKALSTDRLVSAAKGIGRVDVIVAPDHWPDRLETQALTKSFIKHPLVNILRQQGTRIMYVAHGGTEEAFRIGAQFCTAYEIDYISLSTDNDSHGAISRVDATKYILDEGFEGDIHWLGIGQPVFTTVEEAARLGVTSIDGSSPIKIATRGYPFNFPGAVKPTLDLEQGEYIDSMIDRAQLIIAQMQYVAKERTSG